MCTKSGEEQDPMELESKAYQMFEDGSSPVDLVQQGICTSEKAEEIYEGYIALKEKSVEEKTKRELEDKLTTQIGLLGSRLARVELEMMNSFLLPKTIECPSCSYEGKYGVGIICKKCGKVNAYIERDIEEELLKGIEFESYKPWEEED